MSNLRISVLRVELQQALKTLEIATRGKNPPEMVISCQTNELILKVGGSTAMLKGNGFFPGQTRLSGKIVQALRLTLPDTDTVSFEMQPEYIKIGDIAHRCHWENPLTRVIDIPINAPLVQILGIWQHFNDDEIEKSGLKTIFSSADQERQKRIQRALDALSELGVKEEDLVRLVDDAIVRYNQNAFPTD